MPAQQGRGGESIKQRKVYAYIRDPQSGMRVLAHRYLAEQALGRRLLPREVVHHKDGDSLNNDLSNLIVLPSQRVHAHAEFHLRRVNSGMPSLFPELLQVIPSDTWGTLFANVLIWQGQEPPLHQKSKRVVETELSAPLPSLFSTPLGKQSELELLTPDVERGMTTLGELLSRIRVRASGEAVEHYLLNSPATSNAIHALLSKEQG